MNFFFKVQSSKFSINIYLIELIIVLLFYTYFIAINVTYVQNSACTYFSRKKLFGRYTKDFSCIKKGQLNDFAKNEIYVVFL